MPQTFEVEHRDHPWGARGVNSSLEETARKAAEGALRPEVRTYAIEVLDGARKLGRQVNNDRARANEILKACQAKIWVPDPVFAEYIPAAKLLACKKHGDNDSVCVKGDDCDGLVVLCAAMLLSVGLFVMIVGHGYGKDKQIRHVLLLVRIDGKWLYADPSTPEFRGAFPLGDFFPFTHERLLSVPNVKVICDADKCLTSPTMFDPDSHGFIEQGIFVGVNGLDPNAQPEEVSPDDVVFERRLQWIEDEEEDFGSTGPIPKTLGSLGGFSGLGLTSTQEQNAAAINEGLSHTEMILLAGTLISAIGLIWNITRDRRASTQGTPGAALATSNPRT